jgi:glycosyltransferase involved in cell wall biosynthesis
MRVVNIIQRYPPAVGGSETWCQEVSRYLARRGHEVKVLTLDVDKEEEFWREPSDSNNTLALGRLEFDEGVIVRRYRRSLPIHSIHHQFYKKVLDKLFKIYFYGPHSSEMYGRMWREIRLADVVFLHTLPYPHNYVAFALAKLFRKKLVVVPHFHPTHPDYERWSNYLLLKHCDVVITVTEFEKQYLSGKGVNADKLVVTGNAIQPEDYRPQNLDAFKARVRIEHTLQSEDKVIIFVGRKTQEKGVGHLIEAVRELINEMPIKVFLVGPKLDWYERL